jgi:hypothetical protein
MGTAAMEPDLYAIIRRVMQIQQDCYMDYEWDFAETYGRLCRHMKAQDHKPGVAKTFDLLDSLDPAELQEYEHEVDDAR